MERYDFSDLTFSFPRYSLKLGKYIIPILIKIENIKFSKPTELDISLEEDKNFGFEYERLKEIDTAKEYFIHIDTTSKLYNNFSKTFLEYHELKNIDDILNTLDIFDISKFNNSIGSKLLVMVKLFRDRLYNSLKLDEEPPRIDYKSENEKPQNIKDYLAYTNNYVFLQSLIEYSPQPMFRENNNKTPDEWSLREYETRMAYLTAKNRFESTENLWELKSMKSK